MAESGQTIEQLVQGENQQQAGDQVSISNSIGSLRYLSAMDWREFVETMSVVEQALREDPSRVYPRMDFATRDRYRHAVESLARRCAISEAQTARQAVALARTGAAEHGRDAVAAHVGHYLIGTGLARLQDDIGFSAAVAVAATASRRACSGLDFLRADRIAGRLRQARRAADAAACRRLARLAVVDVCAAVCARRERTGPWHW